VLLGYGLVSEGVSPCISLRFPPIYGGQIRSKEVARSTDLGFLPAAYSIDTASVLLLGGLSHKVRIHTFNLSKSRS
jgi:hypothetical protein